MQAQYRNYPQAPPQRSPHANQTRRGQMGMPPNAAHGAPQQTPQQQQIAIAQENQRRELGRRLARRPADKNIPDGVEEVVIGNAVEDYKKLRDVERRLDSVMMRKKLDISDAVARSNPKYQPMRIWISNTAENQPWQQGGIDADAFDFNSENNATWRVKIVGKLLDDEEYGEDGKEDEKPKDPDAMDHDGDEAKQQAAKAAPAALPKRDKLSHFFKQITIDFDRPKALQPDGFAQIEWKLPDKSKDPNGLSPEANFDSLEFERKGDENVNITINLYRTDKPDLFKLSRPLAELIDTEEADRATAMMAIWNYIKANNLQEDEDTRKVMCDARMRAVFNTDSLFFPHIPSLIMPHCHPLPPLQLKYTIRVDKDYISPDSTDGKDSVPSQPTIYDVLVPLSDPLHDAYSRTRTPQFVSTLTQIAALDTNIAETVQAISHAKAKHAFFSSMSRDPVTFVRRWNSSQRRDLEVLLGQATRGGGEDGKSEEWRRGGEDGVWGSGEATESVGLWLARPKAAGH